jgi:DNA-binding NtrC family response regulator
MEGCGREVQYPAGPPIEESSAALAIAHRTGVVPAQADYGTLNPIAAAAIAHLAVLPGHTLPLDTTLRTLERIMIQSAMDACGGSCRKAAEILSVNRPTLVEKRRRLGMPIKARLKPGVRVE